MVAEIILLTVFSSIVIFFYYALHVLNKDIARQLAILNSKDIDEINEQDYLEFGRTARLSYWDRKTARELFRGK